MATPTQRLAGIASFTIDGSAYDCKGSIEYTPSVVTREEMVGQTGPAGYKEMPMFGKIKAKLFDEGGISVSDFNAMTDVTIQIIAANGKTIIGTDMFTTGVQTSNTEEAEFDVEWSGATVTEISRVVTDLVPEMLIELDPPLEWNGGKYDVLELKEPTVAQVIKALADGSGALDGNHKMLLSLIGSVSGKPKQVIEKLPIRKFNEAGSFLLAFLEPSQATTDN